MFDATNPFLNRRKGPEVYWINKTPIYFMSKEEQSTWMTFRLCAAQLKGAAR